MILIAFGANLESSYGPAEQTIKAACEALNDSGVLVKIFSGIWVSDPVPVSDQPLYRNAVAVVETPLSAKALIKLLHEIEGAFGRDRALELARNEARVLDLDLLAHHDQVISDNSLQLPHPRMHERGFVLYPLQQVAPDWVHPVFKRGVGELIDDLPFDGSLRLVG